MARRNDEAGRPFRVAVRKWRFLGGAVGRDGRRVEKPLELVQAEILDGLCQRWGSPPDVVLRQDARLTLHTLWMMAEGRENAEE